MTYRKHWVKPVLQGISIPLAKILLMDKRRAALQQGKIMQQGIGSRTKKFWLNDLLMDATEAYWQWVHSWLGYKTRQQLIDVNSRRYKFVVTAYKMATDLPLILLKP